MSDRTLSALTAAALAGAVSFAMMSLPASGQSQEKCFGISKAGENSCANAAGTHSCAGQSTADYSGGDWKLVAAGTCESMGGKLEPFEGTGQPS
jgi:uncharacterized membrane protein